ncbi:MAG: serine hydrolase [Bacteroidota bacterium]
MIEKGNINSLAIAIYKDSLVYHNYYGAIDKNTQNVPNDNTLYEIASISKVFVGSLAAKAVVENKISLDDDIRLYLEGDYTNLEFEGTPITVRDLVTHTLGFDLPEKLEEVFKKTFNGYYENRAFDYQMEDLLEELKTAELTKKPGTYYDYSNVGPELVAYILEQVYDESYENLLSAFFNEISMESSRLQKYGKQDENIANGYGENDERVPLVGNPFLGGAGGILATLPDMAKFMKFQLESKDPFIKESTRFLFKDEEGDTGYFWDLGVGTKEGFYYQKTGSSNGVESVILICPDSNYGLVMIINNQSEAAIIDRSSLYGRIEYDLIRYPKINLWSLVEEEFMSDPKEAAKKYRQLKSDDQYFASSDYLNNVGYDFIFNDKLKEAIAVFEFAISEDPENANLYDSLGEAYFIAEDYEKSEVNFKKSLELNPSNNNAEKYLSEIKKLNQ